MAVATGVAIAAGVAAAAGAAKTAMGASQARRAKRELDKFKRQELTNIAEGMTVSTLGADLQTQEAQRRFATSVDALQSGGIRGVVGGLAQQEAQQQVLQRQIAADLDQQQRQIEMVRAQDEARIQGMQEQRESFDYQRILGERAAGRQMIGAGIGEIASAGMFLGMNTTGGEGLISKGTAAPRGQFSMTPTGGQQLLPYGIGSAAGFNTLPSPQQTNFFNTQPYTFQDYMREQGGGYNKP